MQNYSISIGTKTITALFAVVTCIYGVLFPFMILFTNIVWTLFWEPDDITTWMIVVTVYFLPMHVIPVIAWAWYSLSQKKFERAIILLFTPAIICIVYVFTIPMMENLALWLIEKLGYGRVWTSMDNVLNFLF